MSDTTTNDLISTPAQRRWATIYGGVTLAYCLALITYLVSPYGQPLNTLHQSALSWAFCLAGAILAAFGFSAITQFLPFTVVKK